MPDRRRFKSIDPLDKRLLKEAERRWLKARDTLPAVVELTRAAQPSETRPTANGFFPPARSRGSP